MLNVQDLERRWLKHKIKSKATLAASILGTAILLIVISIYLISKEETPIEELNVQTPVKSNPKTITTTQPEEVQPEEVTLIVQQKEIAVTQKQQELSTLVLKPSLRFMDSIEDDISPYLDEESSGYVSAYKEPLAKQNATVNTQADIPKKFNTQIQQKKNTTLVTRSSKEDNSDLIDVIKRFKKNKNPVLGLFIAKRYYDVGEYQKSYNYALITNEIDKNIEESWITFSKSLVKLGQNELAINTLKSYLKTTKSTRAATLLQKIKSGEFK